MSNNFMDRLKVFLGITVEPPRNDFRNPIWASDDDDDDGDELYSRHNNVMIHSDPLELHSEITKQMHDIFRSMSSVFGDIKLFFNEDQINSFGSIPAITDTPPEAKEFNSNSIRDYYLKPGYQKQNQEQDISLDGKLSSSEISGLLKQNTDKHDKMTITPFDGNLVPGSSYCKTVITTSIKKPDGSVETKRIVKSGNDVVEETTTTTVPGPNTPATTSKNQESSFTQTNIFLADLTAFYKNFY